MIPLTIEVENYRAFAERQQLELRPLTLLYGINNAGKSALLRALPLIGDSLQSEGMTPLDFDSEAIRGASFRDLRWQGSRAPSPTIDFLFKWDKGAVDYYEIGVAYEDSWNRVVPRRLSVKMRSGHEEQFLCEFVDDEQLEEVLTFRVEAESDTPDQTVKLKWSGMIPSCQNERFAELFEGLSEALDPMTGGVQWLTSIREAPERRSSLSGGHPRRLGPRGAGVVATLHVNEGARASVSEWYESHLSRRLSVIEDGGMLRTVLTPIEEAGFDVDIVDCGEGFIQVLPVLVALAMLRNPRSYTPPILAIEEPESHLHPQLQRALSEHLCDVAADCPDRRIVLETHSEHLLLGIRIALLEGRIDPEDIAIHWVEQTDSGSSDVHRVLFDENAELAEAWPSSVYSDDTEMSRKIWTLRQERQG